MPQTSSKSLRGNITVVNFAKSRGKRDLTSSFGDGGSGHGGLTMPPIPTHCAAEHCRNDAAVIMVEATHKSGPKKLYAFSEVCRKSGDNMQPNDGVTFHSWRSWCARHYMLDLDKGKKTTPERFNPGEA